MSRREKRIKKRIQKRIEKRRRSYHRECPGQCPACEMRGWTPERASKEHPEYMIALRSLPPGDVPDFPADECWDCRRLRQAGFYPPVLAGLGKRRADGNY